jgi:hypothetical protein
MTFRRTKNGKVQVRHVPPLPRRSKNPWDDKRHRWAAWFKSPDTDTCQLYYCVACGLLTAKVKDDHVLEYVAKAIQSATHSMARMLTAQLFQPSPVFSRLTSSTTAAQPTTLSGGRGFIKPWRHRGEADAVAGEAEPTA